MKSQKQHEHYNIQGELIENLAERLFILEDMLSKAYNGKARAYRESLSWVIGLKNKIKSLKLGYDEKKMIKVELLIKISKALEYSNNFEEGSNYMWEALILITNILKDNDMIFPKKITGMSFSKFVESETK